ESSSTEVVTVQEALDALEASYARPKAMAAPRPAVALEIDDHELLERARSAANGARFSDLYDRGNTAPYQHEDGTPDLSSADLALCNHLAFWCAGDETRMDRLFRASALMRDKWERADYRALTMGEAIRSQTSFYEGSVSVAVKPPTVRLVEGGNNGNHPPVEEDPSFASFASFALRASSATPPEDLEPEALYGLLGEIVMTIGPHTESHPAALLLSAITTLGCMFGRDSYVYRDGARHAPNEFGCLVGLSGISRKGTAGRRINELLTSVVNSSNNSNYNQKCVHVMHEAVPKLYGLGSGEALVASLCEEPEAGQPLDVRRLVLEEEFSRCLKAMARDGSTLSEFLRQAWDGGVLASRTKGKRLEAGISHVGMMGHITDVELKEELSRASMFNGFANRFLWFCTRRVRSLPFGGGDPPTAAIVLRLREILEWAAGVGRVDFDEETRALWDQGGIYNRLLDRPGGLLGSVTGRGEAHVTRLALLYALLDAEREIRPAHLLGALAVWDYNERSCAYIFGKSTGNDYADQIDELLCDAYPGGLTKSEISKFYSHHAPAGKINEGLQLLLTEGRAAPEKLKTPGRPTELWMARSSMVSEKSEGSEKSPLVLARELMGRSWQDQR
ncbi:MAG: DUF3987 domain-containing protein, partial [Blastocatellia bacterium]|nr:DUF3987 domain-containing protein [Blastocatellia bacterium]